jgi:hypothetical protein
MIIFMHKGCFLCEKDTIEVKKERFEMTHSALLNFTSAGLKNLIGSRGSKWFKVNKKIASKVKFLVCVQNQKGDPRYGASAPHRTAFLIGHIAGIVPSPRKDSQRSHIAISDYAEINIPDAWGGWQYPVHYTTLEDIGIDLDKLDFTPPPKSKSNDSEATADNEGDEISEYDDENEFEVRPLTIDQAKACLAAHLKVKPEPIKITIEW